MTDTGSRHSAAMRWRSLTPISLFRFGPWEAITPLWIAAAIVAAVWERTPCLRIGATFDVYAAAMSGAMFGGMIASIATGRLWGQTRHLRALVAVSIAAGAAAGAIGAGSLLTSTLGRASSCAPVDTVPQPTVGAIAGRVLPWAMWLVWSFFLLNRFPTLERSDWIEQTSRYERYGHELKRVLPRRVAMSILAVAILHFLAVRATRSPSDTASAREIIAAFAVSPIASRVDRDGGGRLHAVVEGARRNREKEAVAYLADLDLDHARPALADAACTFAMPGAPIAATLVERHDALERLDGEIRSMQTAWRPSAATAEALVSLIPISGNPRNGDAIFPFFWSVSPANARVSRVDSGALLTVTYENEPVMIVQMTRGFDSGSGTSRIVAVAVKLLGRAAADPALEQTVTRRLGVSPDGGGTLIGQGARCARWLLGDVAYRLGPRIDEGKAAEPLDETSPVWLSCFDVHLAEQHLAQAGGRWAWNPYGCEPLSDSRRASHSVSP